MSTAKQAFQHPPNSHRYAVDLGWKGLGHDRDPQSDARARRLSNQALGVVHARAACPLRTKR